MNDNQISKPRGIVLMSGGLDSCVLAAIAFHECHAAALHISYGQLTQQREKKAFLEITDFLGIQDRLAVDQSYLGRIGGSALTDPEIPLRKADLNSKVVPTSYVPFRNANFLSLAVSWAEATGAERIYIGAVEPDSSGYPDCRPEYYRIFNQLIEAGTRQETSVRILTPLIFMRKHEIVNKGIEIKAPLHLSWSCYQQNEIACGVCDSCALRLRAYKNAGIMDSIPYASAT